MSWYTNYYLGYITPDQKIYPLGPFNHEGKYVNVLSKSRSFTTRLRDEMEPVADTQVSDELKQALFANSEVTSNYAEQCYLGYVKLANLPDDDYVKRGYFLISDISEYLTNDHDTDNLFYDKLSPEIYAMKLTGELVVGSDAELDDPDIGVHSCKDYAYFAYPDYASMEYEIDILRRVANMLLIGYTSLPEHASVVVLKTEG